MSFHFPLDLKFYIPGSIFLTLSAVFIIELIVNKLLKRKQSATQVFLHIFIHYVGIKIVSMIINANIVLPEVGVKFDLTDFWKNYPVITSLFIIFAYEFNTYIFHRLFHSHPLLWPFHEPHHSSSELNMSVSVRNGWFIRIIHHFLNWPFYAFISMLGIDWQMAFVVNQLYVSLYQNFSHINWGFENSSISRFLILPSDHSVHHESISTLGKAYNYGTLLSIFDHFFGTYRASSDNEKKIYGCLPKYNENNIISVQFAPLKEIGKLIKTRSTFSEIMQLIFLGKLS